MLMVDLTMCMCVYFQSGNDIYMYLRLFCEQFRFRGIFALFWIFLLFKSLPVEMIKQILIFRMKSEMHSKQLVNVIKIISV